MGTILYHNGSLDSAYSGMLIQISVLNNLPYRKYYSEDAAKAGCLVATNIGCMLPVFFKLHIKSESQG